MGTCLFFLYFKIKIITQQSFNSVNIIAKKKEEAKVVLENKIKTLINIHVKLSNIIFLFYKLCLAQRKKFFIIGKLMSEKVISV